MAIQPGPAPQGEVQVFDASIVLEVSLGVPPPKFLQKMPGDSVSAMKALCEIDPSIFDSARRAHVRKLLQSVHDAGVKLNDNPDLPMSFLRFERALSGDKAASDAGTSVSIVLEYRLGNDRHVMFFPPPVSGHRLALEKAHEEAKAFVSESIELTRREKRTTIDSLARSFRRADGVLILLSQGFTRAAVSRATRLPPSSVNNFGNGKIPLDIFMRTDEQRASSKNAISFPRFESTSFAYIIGLYLGTGKVSEPIKRVGFASPSPTVREKIARAFDSTFGKGLLAEERAKSKGRVIVNQRVRSVDFAKRMHTITGGLTRVPWEHVVTPAETAALLEGIFDKTGTISEREILLNKTGGEKLLRHVAAGMARLGIFPRFHGGRNPYLSISRCDDFVRFAQLVKVSDEKDAANLTRRCAQRDGNAFGTIEEYELVMSFEGSRLTDAQIADRCVVSEDRVTSWLKRRHVPVSVSNRNDLLAELSSLPDIRLPGHIVRDLGGTMDLVVALDHKGVNLDETVRVTRHLSGADEVLKELDALFASPEGDTDVIVPVLLRPLHVLKARVKDVSDSGAIAAALIARIADNTPALSREKLNELWVAGTFTSKDLPNRTRSKPSSVKHSE